VVLATLKALGKEMDDLDIVNLGVDSSLEAGVSVTGAFDDATASYFGGVVVTDNMKREIIAKHKLEDYFSSKKILTSQADVGKMKALAPDVSLAWELARKGKIFEAMNLNSRLYCKALDYDQKIAEEALKAGALGATLSGTGPAFVAIAKEAENIKEVWEKYEGTVKILDINTEKAG
jgi:shikimate kinase